MQFRGTAYNYREQTKGEYCLREYNFQELLEASIKASSDYPNEYGVTQTNESFYGTNSFAKTVEFAKHGNLEVTERVKTLVDKISGTFSFSSTNDYIMDVTGQTLDIGVLLTGNPECWLQPIESKSLRSDKLIEISTEFSFSGATDKNDIQFRGALIASLVDALRQRGFSVKLTIIHTSNTRGLTYKDGKQYAGHCIRTTLINYGEIPDLSLFAFYLADVSCYRRLVFSAQNEITGKSNTAVMSYACDTQEQHKSKFHIESNDGLFHIYGNTTDRDIKLAQDWLAKKLTEISEISF